MLHNFSALSQLNTFHPVSRGFVPPLFSGRKASAIDKNKLLEKDSNPKFSKMPSVSKKQILFPVRQTWQKGSLTNPGAARAPQKKKGVLLYGANYVPDKIADIIPQNRAPHGTDGKQAYSLIGLLYFKLSNGKILKAPEHPIKLPIVPEQVDGLPDPRITYLKDKKGGVYLITYNAVNTAAIDKVASASKSGYLRNGARIFSTTTRDFKHYTPPIQVGPSRYEKNGVFFPKKFKENQQHYLYLLHRTFPNIQIAKIPVKNNNIPKTLQKLNNPFARQRYESQFDDKTLQSLTVMKPVLPWEGVAYGQTGQIAPGSQPIQVSFKGKRYWLLFYNAAPQYSANPTDLGRVVGAALLDFNNPLKLLHRGNQPVIKSTEPFELGEITTSQETLGTVKDVTFATGALIANRNQLTIFYGTKDKFLAQATLNLTALLQWLVQFDEKGQPLLS